MRLTVGGGQVEYDLRGAGPALLFLNAFPLPLAMWDAACAELAPLYTTVRFDPRGLGASAPAGAQLTMERFADDALALLDHLGLSRVVVIGCSMGGYAALALQRRRPERLRGIVLCDTRAEADTPESRAGRGRLVEQVRRRGATPVAEAFVPKLLGTTSHSSRPAVVEWVQRQVLATPPQGLIDGLQGLAARGDSRPTLREIAVPTLVLVGEEDTITPPEAARALHAGIAGSRVELLPKVGHLPMLEDPALFNRTLRQFLDGLE